jgi:hypothetical protein
LTFSKKKKNLICSKNIDHIFVLATSAKIWAVLHVYRGSMDAGNKAFVQFNENSHSCVEFTMYSLELEIKFEKKNLFPTDLPYFFSR